MDNTLNDDEEDKETSIPHVLSRNQKHLTTIAIVLGNICTGTAYGTYGPALVDLKHKYGTTLAEISTIFTILNIGYIVGAIATGFAFKLINRQLGIIFLHTGTALAMYLTPHCPSTPYLFCACGLLGVSAGAYDAAQVVWMIEMWQAEAGPYIQAQGMGWALGNFVPSLLLAPFLTPEAEGAPGTNTTESRVGHSPRNPNMYVPFTIAGTSVALVGIYQIFLFTCHRYFPPPPDPTRPDAVVMEMVAQPKMVRRVGKPVRSTRQIQMIILTAIFLGADQGLSMCTIAFLPTFVQYSGLRLSQRDGAYISSGMNGAKLGGQILGILVAIKVPAQFMFCTNLLVLGIANMVLLVLADASLAILWACAVGMGLGLSTTNPSFTTFIERHLLYTNGVGSIIFTFGSLVNTVYPVVIGRYMEANPSVLMYTNFFSLFWMVLATIVLFRITLCRNKERSWNRFYIGL